MTGTVVEMGISLDDFVLAHTLTAVEDLNCEVERIVASDRESVMPFLWAEAPPPALDEIEDAFATDETVDQITLIANLEGEHLYQMQWTDKIELLLKMLFEEEGMVLSARATAEGWTLRLLFPTREAASRTHDHCRGNGIQCEIRTVYNVDEGRHGRFGLTEGQQDTLVAAFKRGYYDIPRGIEMEELADEFDISHQALSERLRRAHGSLVKNTVLNSRRSQDRNL